MIDKTDTVDKLGRRRALMAMILGLAFVATQMNRFEALRTGDYIGIAAWTVWTLGMVMFVLFGAGLWRGARIRAMLNDETTAANRQTAIICGFWFAMLGAGLNYARTFYMPLTAQEALHSVVTFAVGFAIFQFGILEWKAHRE